MINRMSGSLAFFVAITLVIAGVIAYLGFRTLEHEALLRHYQSQSLARTRIAQAEALVVNLLEQKAVRLDAVTDFIELHDDALRTLVERDGDIDGVFALQKDRLLYPDERQALTQKEKDWMRTVLPLVHDPSLLYSHNEQSEKEPLRAGWFIINETREPVLIYWRGKGNQIVGFRVSYIKLLSDVINAADFDFSPDLLTLKEGGRLLYQSHADEQTATLSLQASAYLPYPLNNWRIEYYSQKTSAMAIYLWGGLFLLLILAAVALIMIRLYREYTQTARLARQQVNFVSQVSHELKTPLTNITLYAELLKEELGESDRDESRHADVIASESQRLSRLIQNILTFTRTPKIHIQPVDVNQLVTQIAATFTPSFEARGIGISVHAAEQVTLDSDVDRLTQIISNFLSNAEKYAAAGGQVELTVETFPEHVDIHVRDFGPGIPEKEVRKIFQPFYRVRSAITEGVSGTGIGLTIARQLAETLRGEILVSHPSPGVRFTLRLRRNDGGTKRSFSGAGG